MALLNEELNTKVDRCTIQYCKELFKEMLVTNTLLEKNLDILAILVQIFLTSLSIFWSTMKYTCFLLYPLNTFQKVSKNFGKNHTKSPMLLANSPLCYKIQSLADLTDSDVVYAACLKKKI